MIRYSLNFSRAISVFLDIAGDTESINSAPGSESNQSSAIYSLCEEGNLCAEPHTI